MTWSLAPAIQADCNPKHSTAKEFDSVLRTFIQSCTAERHRCGRQAFVEAVPDLRVWFAAPLKERLGRFFRDPPNRTRKPIFHESRGYLCFLAYHGYIRLDFEWLIALPRLDMRSRFAGPTLEPAIAKLIDEACQLGYNRRTVGGQIRKALTRILLHKGTSRVEEVSDLDCDEYRQALNSFRHRSDLRTLFGSAKQYTKRWKDYSNAIYVLHTVLFHRGQVTKEPWKIISKPSAHQLLKPRMEALIQRYLSEKALTCRPSTVSHFDRSLRYLGEWLLKEQPSIKSFGEVTREQVLRFRESLNHRVTVLTKRKWSEYTKRGVMCTLCTFARDVSTWGWEDAPTRPWLGAWDLPKMPHRVPRYIPEAEFSRLMVAIRALHCDYQRTALLIARWSGARRDEIQRLEMDCLDTYPDGTARLRIPAGKCKKERSIPLNEEAASAIRSLLQRHPKARGYRDSQTGVPTHYLFLNRGKPYHLNYLFYKSLAKACTAAGLVDAHGKPTITPHRFRHTVGKQLSEGGASLQTIMSILGHTNADMSMRYAQISDPVVLKDYQAVLGPGATIAGPCAEALRAGRLSASEIDWIKSNFFKTELELGHCLRLPQEGPCECDLYLNCTKFVTTPEYAPRLRHRRKQELALMEDAASRGWKNEVERHRCPVRRIEQLLADLGEQTDGRGEKP